MVCSGELLLLRLSLGRVTTTKPVLGSALHPLVEQGVQNRYSGDRSELRAPTSLLVAVHTRPLLSLPGSHPWFSTG